MERFAALAVLSALAIHLATPTGTAAETVPVSKSAQQMVKEATITLLPARCTGVIVGDPQHAITAAHCLGRERSLDVGLHDGERVRATVERVDRGRDVALLRLETVADVRPLQVGASMPRLGEALYFGGRRDRKGSAQIFAVVRIGPCPSLPQVPNAIFTNLRARKGDSGAPLVNRSLEVVALVHGGAGCNIAAPIVGIGSHLGLDELRVDGDRAEGLVDEHGLTCRETAEQYDR